MIKNIYCLLSSRCAELHSYGKGAQGSIPEGTSLTKMTYNPPHTLGSNLKRVNEGPICLPHLWKSANQKTAAIKGCSPAGVGVVGGEVLEKQAVEVSLPRRADGAEKGRKTCPFFVQSWCGSWRRRRVCDLWIPVGRRLNFQVGEPPPLFLGSDSDVSWCHGGWEKSLPKYLPASSEKKTNQRSWMLYTPTPKDKFHLKYKINLIGYLWHSVLLP